MKYTNVLHNYDFTCTSETYLDSSMAQSSEEIQIDGYSLIRSDHPSDSKKGSVSLYSEAATGGVLYKKVSLKISQISLENTCLGVSFY